MPGETCSLRGQLETKKLEKFKSEVKLEILKLESSRRSWKIRAEIGELGLKFESIIEVGKWLLKLELDLEKINEVEKLLFNLVTSELSNCSQTFQLWKKLSIFARVFPTSLDSFQLKQKLSNFRLSINRHIGYVSCFVIPTEKTGTKTFEPRLKVSDLLFKWNWTDATFDGLESVTDKWEHIT